MAEQAIMAEEMKPEKKIAFANRKYTNEEKRKMEEEELEQLMKEQKGEVEQEATAEPEEAEPTNTCLLYTSPSPRDGLLSRMPSSA